MGIEKILDAVRSGDLSVKDALARINASLEQDLQFAKIDTDRPRRCGMPEAVYGPGKTTDQIIEIISTLKRNGQDALVTRVTPEQFEIIHREIRDAVYHTHARLLTVDGGPRPAPEGLVAVACAGTSDIPVADEAAITAERMGAKVERVYDVGVAGLHRLMRHLPLLRSARVVIAVAGMEGALPSVMAGLIDRPVIAVPTSVGYGAGLNGLAALLAMLNSCAPGVTVVNIDNGFGAGVAAAMINRTGKPRTPHG